MGIVWMTVMGRRMLLCAFFAFSIPVFCMVLNESLKYKRIRKHKYILIIGYCFLILFYTINRKPDATRGINLVPFWSYAFFDQSEYRWQIYMNIFLFIPFGFLLPFALNRSLFQTVLFGFVFSACIEALQYFLRLGLCELDDVIHNTMGTIVGYGYWKSLKFLTQRYGESVTEGFERFRKRIRKKVD